ncbi:G-type lectin S-receptor-like serine/threonine-protein kinase At4g03230 isoform X2 [Abrus precatorius]|uniref:Receptor-like serine/threonine-protein kinase n=1 Tax=Abrus precatorius TaxID=3816 RepID=A0A8B8KKD9_ABRPR|nr:G-type lectin S-receptor-like serine/threonine-protein kinase At4g03230 isoform X2 [Abrus precatorius]
MRTTHAAFSLLCWLLCSQSCSATDTLNQGEKITQELGNLVSAESTFELGFFSFPDDERGRKYLGIWYWNLEPRTAVWVANRDKPVEDSSAVFQIARDGNLVIAGASQSYWSSGLNGSSSSTTSNRTVKLLDSGNLVLMNNNNNNLWQSFQHPTDTFLPGMKMDANFTLTSGRSAVDPGSGSFSLKLVQTGNDAKIVVNNHSQLYWTLDERDSEATSIYNFLAFVNATNSYASRPSPFINISHPQLQPRDFDKSRLVMNFTGEVNFLKWEEDVEKKWDRRWWWPHDDCDKHNFCGYFSSCNKNNWQRCKCLPGFHRGMSDNQQHHGDFHLPGCVRKSKSCTNENMMFLNLTKIKVGKPDLRNRTETEEKCQSLCLNMCYDSHIQCQAYSYNISATSYNRGSDPNLCEIWTRDLPSLQEDDDSITGRYLSILVKSSDIAPTAKSCEPCGTYTIPYPLSTGPTCGDPAYYKFNCHEGQVSFMMPGGKHYRVTWIDVDTRKFYIQTDDSNHCDQASINQNDSPNFPFSVTNWCFKDDEIEISWQSAQEPPCSNPIDCKLLSHSTCRPTNTGDTRCLCDLNYNWNATIFNCTKESSENHSTHRLALILTTILIGMTILASIIVFVIVRRRKTAPNMPDVTSTRIQESLYDSERHVKGLIGLGSLEEKDVEGIEVPCYTFASILAATDNFSDSNKLGQGGYGPVYKGTFPSGQDIAVKRLSSVSTQGLQEFKNEVVLIAKLQHRNLVRVRGYCIKGDEKVLLYEYMPNKSLDSFIFDRTRTLLLDWPMRFDIIVGIARGLLYLHQDSRLRVIHRDLKTSNILLDEDMNPKISDFGLAKIFGGKETEASTERVVGTYGYMAPEYALDGYFSIKSDVFSFGVVVLEILSGKKNTGFYQSKQISSLLGYVCLLHFFYCSVLVTS